MAHGILESDWKAFRKIRETALDRLCGRVLGEVESVIREGSRTNHERYREVFRLLHDRDDDVAWAFDAPRRSRMLQQLAAIHSLDLIEPSELTSFSPETRETIERISKSFNRK